MKTKTLFTIICFFCLSISLFAQSANNTQLTLADEEPQPTIIELLQNGESYEIEITSVGCFSGSRQTLVISKESDVFTANFQEVDKVLSTDDIEALRIFELQLRSLNMGGCTTVDTYVIRYGNDTFQTSDGTCSWNGGRKLLDAII